jgi:aspartyl-tRNA(Asn)/glutamyl-tRNA(Gln) amidotransferase subunit A
VSPNSLYQSVRELSRLIRTKQVSPVEITKGYLERAQEIDPHLFAFVTFTEDLAMQQAREAELRAVKGKLRSTLDGIPWGVKDLFATNGIPTQWGSPAFQGQVFDYDATIVRKLREQGAVLIGKLASGELASGARWFGGTTRCPWDLTRSSSGSSAGPASATAAGLVGFSVGTETLGSIISPAATNGVVGLRPTYGRVSRYGAMALSWTMDKVGPICRTVQDCAMVFDKIHGFDPLDPTSADGPTVGTLRKAQALQRAGSTKPPHSIKGKRIAIIRDEFNSVTDPQVATIYRDALMSLEGLELVLEDIPLDDYPYQDIARYTLNIEAATVFEPLWKTGRLDLLINKQRAMDWSAARLLPATDYLKMQRLRAEISEYAAQLFMKYAALVAPSLTSPASLVDSPNVTAANPAAITTGGGGLALGNITGLPAVSVPCGFTAANLPLGLQFIGAPFEEAALLRLAHAYEQANSWHERHPRL